jgi:hypothetical protein
LLLQNEANFSFSRFDCGRLHTVNGIADACKQLDEFFSLTTCTIFSILREKLYDSWSLFVGGAKEAKIEKNCSAMTRKFHKFNKFIN